MRGAIPPLPNTPSWRGAQVKKITGTTLIYLYTVIRGCIQKFPDWVHNEINNNNKHSLRSNIKGYGGKTHYTDSQNSATIALNGGELYHLQFWLQAASPETFGYTLVFIFVVKHVFPSFKSWRRVVLWLDTWRWKQQRPTKPSYLTTTLHGIIIQKTSTLNLQSRENPKSRVSITLPSSGETWAC
jgi:hypothetical protein